MYVLYGGDFTRAPLVQWLLAEGGIGYEFRKVDILQGEHKSAAFLAINPAGLVPVLITPEGEALTEVAALLVYLADRHGLESLAPAVTDPDRGPFLAAVFHVATDIQAEIKRFHFPHRYSLRRADDAGIRDLAKALVFGRLGIIDGRLARRGPYFLGSRFSLADFYLCFWVAYLDRQGACARFPSIAALYDRVRARPLAARYLDETETMASAYDRLMGGAPGGVIA